MTSRSFHLNRTRNALFDVLFVVAIGTLMWTFVEPHGTGEWSWLRVVVVAQAAFAIGITLSIWRDSVLDWWSNRRALLPLHIWLISAGTCGLSAGYVGAMDYLIDRHEHLLWWGAPTGLVSYTLIISGLAVMLRIRSSR